MFNTLQITVYFCLSFMTSPLLCLFPSFCPYFTLFCFRHSTHTLADTHQAVVFSLVCDLPLFPLAVQWYLVQVAQSWGCQQQQQADARKHPEKTARTMLVSIFQQLPLEGKSCVLWRKSCCSESCFHIGVSLGGSLVNFCFLCHEHDRIWQRHVWKTSASSFINNLTLFSLLSHSGFRHFLISPPLFLSGLLPFMKFTPVLLFHYILSRKTAGFHLEAVWTLSSYALWLFSSFSSPLGGELMDMPWFRKHGFIYANNLQ